MNVWGSYFLLHVDFLFFFKTPSKSGVTGSSRVLNNVKHGLTDETDDAEDVDDADEVERVVTICGAYCGVGATSGGGCIPGGEGGCREYAPVTCAGGTPRAYIDGGGGWGITLLV